MSPTERARLARITEPAELLDALELGCHSPAALYAFVQPWVTLMIQTPLLLSERDVLIARAANLFRCSASSLLIDLRRARIQRAANEERAEIAALEQWWQL